MVDIQKILEHLPHRYPFLLVDRLLDLNEEYTHGRGLKNVTINEQFFQGHYPGMPIMPGVLIIEAIAQVAAAVILVNPKNSLRIPILGALDNVKFKRMVVPGDQLIIDTEILWVRGFFGKGTGVATVDGEVVASAELMFKLIDRNS